VPYRGNAPAMQDLVGGQIDMMIVDPVTSLPQLRAGRIKVVAVMAKSRTATAPDIPTVDEAGSPGLYIAPWQAIWAPKGTPTGYHRQAQPSCRRCVGRPRHTSEARRPEL
jgi:tripartite-type tricarboxylate transporter receptor subunit TctC